MTKIQVYDPYMLEVSHWEHLYNAKTGTFEKFKLTPQDVPSLDQILDGITLAAEAGQLDDETWVKQVFHDKRHFDWFLGELSGYNVCFRINDRWYHALERLVGGPSDEEGFVTSEEIADALLQHARETKQYRER